MQVKEIFAEEIKILIWAITKSDISECSITAVIPAVSWIPRYKKIVIDYDLPFFKIEIFIPVGVRSHWENRKNPNFIPDFSDIDDIPF